MGSRPLTALAFAVLAGLGFVFLIPDCASACTCGSTSSNGQKEIESELSSSEAVFSGEVVDFEKGSSIAAPWPTETVSFRVSEVWKGPEREILEVSTATQGSACGYAFKRDESTWSTPTGSRTSRSIFAAGLSRSPRRAQASRCLGTAARSQRKAAKPCRTPQGVYRRVRWSRWRGWRWRRRSWWWCGSCGRARSRVLELPGTRSSRSSRNSVLAKFRELPFYEVGCIR